MANYTVDNFVIEMGFSEKVIKPLESLEKKVGSIAQKMELSLNRVFNRMSGAEKMANMFARIERNAQSTATNINKSLNKAFDIKTKANAFQSLEEQAALAGKKINDSLKIKGFSNIPVTTSTKLGRPALTDSERITNLAMRSKQSALYGNMLLKAPDIAKQFESRLAKLVISAEGNFSTFQKGVRALNFEFNQLQRSARMAEQELRKTKAIETDSSNSGLLKFATLITAASVAVELFKSSLQEGMRRQQVTNMTSAAFGSDARNVQQGIKGVSDQLGIKYDDAADSAARLRNSFSTKLFSNKDIIDYLRTSTVFGHVAGVDNAHQQLVSNALEQISATPKGINGQDFNQLRNDSPAILSAARNMHGFTSNEQLKDYWKSMTGDEVVKDLVKGMEQFNQKTHALEKTINSTQSAIGRLENSVTNSQNSFFTGFNNGLIKLANSLGTFLEASSQDGEILGAVLGDVFSRLSSVVDEISTVVLNINGALGLIEVYWIKFFNDLPKPMQDSLKRVSDILVGFIETITGLAALNKIKQFTLGTAKKAGSLLGKGGAEVAEAGAETGKGLSRFIPGAGQLLAGWDVWNKWKTLSDSITSGTKGSTSVWDAIQKRAHGWASYKDGDSFDAGTKGIPDWLTRQITIPPLQGNLKVDVQGHTTVDMKLPDGSIQQVAVPLMNQTMQLGFEDMIMNNSNLGRSSWENESNNAGWYPSENK
ncbi:hypothetical protein [Mangrovibacter yixingensis]|uniref:hypothetical protein n=1 Tax=Mangrovibacter yixingensis TaxID=1529639 RepID=UPI001CFD601F|nr:hypothetical protein [Mangrovibacter yixingensis]